MGFAQQKWIEVAAYAPDQSALSSSVHLKEASRESDEANRAACTNYAARQPIATPKPQFEVIAIQLRLFFVPISLFVEVADQLAVIGPMRAWLNGVVQLQHLSRGCS